MHCLERMIKSVNQGGFGLGWIARRIFAYKGRRKYLRVESDHPLVKRIKKEGYS